jgi:D-ala D-ala ligase C-terminus
MEKSLGFLCVSTYFKGNDFMKACKEAGNRVYLITDKKLEHKPWVRDYIDDIFYVEAGTDGQYNAQDLLTGLAYTMRNIKIDRIVALDDFDVERAAHLREHFRIPGMGQTTARHFRDKLAMRIKAAEAGIKVPPFSSLFHDDDINAFANSVKFPCVVKPRGEASTTGIKKVWSAQELWDVVHGLGDRRHEYLVEQFRPGDVFHVDSLSLDGKILFTRASQYLATPMEVAHGGGVFRSCTVSFDSDDEKQLLATNDHVMKAFGMQYSASHSEFIKCKETGDIYFLETASRVGGAHLSDMVEASSNVNLWREWAKLETAVARGEQYQLPPVRNDYSGIVISLSRQQWPDMAPFQEAEICWRMNEEYHVGLIVKSESRQRVLDLLDGYAQRILSDYHASAPVPDKPTH